MAPSLGKLKQGVELEASLYYTVRCHVLSLPFFLLQETDKYTDIYSIVWDTP